MNKRVSLLLALMLATLAVSGTASAHDRRWRGSVGIHFGFPVFAPWGYPPPYSYYPPTVVTVPAPPPPVYIEQAPAAAPASNWWHYCGSLGAYYPYVRQCPEGWQRVAPQPPPPPG